MSKDKPNSFDIQKDINEFLSKKYGGRVVIADPNIEGGEEGDNINKKKSDIHFDYKPIDLEKYIKEYLVGQEQAIDIIATKICTHFNRMNYEKKHPNSEKLVGGIKGNILMVGPTGVGKTYIIKLIADKIGVPFVKGDATKFTETGYVGGDVEDLVRDLVRQADGEISKAEYGIIYLDEIDKIASTTNHFGPDVSRSGVQRNLLKIMEESEVDLKSPMDMASQMEAVMQAQKTGKIDRKKISTKSILFVMSGAFQGLNDIIKKRLNTQPLGFMSTEKKGIDKDENWLKHVTTQDLLEYGFESEFVGRLPVIAILHDLDMDGLYQILKTPKNSIVLGKKRDFLAYGIDLEFEDNALRKIAEKASLEKTGARGLVSVCEKVLIRFEKYLPSSSIKKLIVTEELVDNPDLVLHKMLAQDGINSFSKEFFEKHGITLEFTNDALETIIEKSKKENITPYNYCYNVLNNYEYGLKLIGKSYFKVDSKLLNNHQKYLDELIKKAYESNKK